MLKEVDCLPMVKPDAVKNTWGSAAIKGCLSGVAGRQVVLIEGGDLCFLRDRGIQP